MKERNRARLVALGASAVICAARAASASVLFYDPFDYSGAPHTLPGYVDTYAPYQTSGANTWIASSSGTTPTIASGDLTYAGLPNNPVESNAVSAVVGGGSTGISRIQFSGSQIAGPSDPSGQSYVYYSMLVNVPSNVASLGVTGTTGSFFAGLQYVPLGGLGMTTTTASTAAALCIRKDADGTQYDLGIGYRDTATRQFTTALNPGQTYLVVVEYNSNQTLTNSDSKDDSAYIWIDPDLNSIPIGAGSANPAVGTATQSSVNTGTTDDYYYASATSQTVSGVESLELRENTSLPSSIDVDEVRIGNTWADVTTVPEPASLSLIALSGAGLLTRRKRRS